MSWPIVAVKVKSARNSQCSKDHLQKWCWSKAYNMIQEIVPVMSFWFTGYSSILLAKALRNFYLITDAQARTCDYCFHVKWEVSWISSLLNYRPKCVKTEGKGQLNWQLAKLDMFGKNENERLWTLCYKLGRDSTFFFWYSFFVSSPLYTLTEQVVKVIQSETYSRDTDIHMCPLHTCIHTSKESYNTLKLTLCASRRGVAGRRGWTRWGSWRVQL